LPNIVYAGDGGGSKAGAARHPGQTVIIDTQLARLGLEAEGAGTERGGT
jgi:hypothetical protein